MAGMDEDRLTLSPDYQPDPHKPQRKKRRDRERRRWVELDERLDEAVHDRRNEAYAPRPPRAKPRRDRPLPTVLAAAALVFCIAFAAAPLLAFRAVRSAAHFGDVAALSELVDYNAVRQSLRTQVRPASAERQPPSDLLHDPVGAIRRALEPVSPQADVDRYLTPDALASLTEGRDIAVQPSPADSGGLFGGPVPAVRYWGTERVRLGVMDPADDERETVFTFKRENLFQWRLVGVLLPPQAIS